MESPCACSGTMKFAHRGCIQRWCDEKRSTICEICLEKFEPGYTVTAPSPAKPHLPEVVITIRGSLEAARLNNELQNPAMVAFTDNQQELEQCSPRSHYGKYCFPVALMFAIMFLLRHVEGVTLFGSDNYSSPLSFDLQVFLLRAVGVLLPFYLIIQLITKIRNGRRYQHLQERNGDLEDAIEEQQNII